MNEKTEQLLQQLADKLGTTTEYLWKILVSQARYDAIISGIQMAFMFAIIYWTIKLHIRFSKEDDNGRSVYYNKEELAVIPMILAGITSIIMIVFFLSGFNDLVSSIFNPEYWALNKVMQMLK